MPIFYTVLPVAMIMIKACNTIIANSIPDFHNWPQAGKGRMRGKCNRLTDFSICRTFMNKIASKIEN